MRACMTHSSKVLARNTTMPGMQAKLDQTRVSAEWLERLSEQTKTPTSQLKFIIDAWAQVGVSNSLGVVFVLGVRLELGCGGSSG